MTQVANRRVLIVDDNAAIHEDFRKILQTSAASSVALADSEAALFGEDTPAAADPATAIEYEMTFTLQGQDALARVEAAQRDGLPIALAFVDMRMPPGWDGVETIRRLWAVEPDLQVVVCTAYSDYSWPEMVTALGHSDRMLILKKPFDPVEVAQLAATLTEKWNTMRREREHLDQVVRSEERARAYAASLETVNNALEVSWARSRDEVQRGRALLTRAAERVLQPLRTFLVDDVVAKLATDTPAAEASSSTALQISQALTYLIEYLELDGGRTACNEREVRPVELAREVARAAGAQPSIQVVATPELDRAHVAVDADGIASVLRELVVNARRHAGAGPIELRVERQGRGADCELAFCVRDHGPGLTREAQSYLFEPFSPSGPAGGFGLGLAVCKRRTELLGGTLQYTPLDGGGAEFKLCVPLRSSAIS